MGGQLRDIAFNNASNNREYNIFTPEYYGGADVRIYINKRLYPNISSIQVSVREQQKPIYGYSSRVYDDIAHGTRIVQGAIRVPVKNAGPSDKVKAAARTVIQNNNSINVDVPAWVYDSDNNYDINYVDQKAKVAETKTTDSKFFKKATVYIAPFDNARIIDEIINTDATILGSKNNFLFIEYTGKRGYVRYD